MLNAEIGPVSPWYERAEIKGMEITVYSGGQVFKTASNPLHNPTERKGSRVYWIEMPGDTYAITGIAPSGERVRIASPSWHAVKGIQLIKGTRWLLRSGKKWKINSI
jgi:hypothetical protein